VWLRSDVQRSSTIEVSLAVTPTVSRGVHDSRAEHWCIATERPAAVSCARCDTVHTHSTVETCTTGSGLVRAPQTRHQASLDAPLSCCNVHDARLPILDGAGADVIVLVRGKQLPVVVLMRGGGRRCTWSVDAVGGLSAKVLEERWDGQGAVRGGVWGVDGTWWSLYT
jgi:hypothetical protein